MSDYIKREDAIAAFKKYQPYMATDGIYNLKIALENEIPAADVVKRKHGHWGYRWKIHGDGRRPTELFPCSECGFENTCATNFCPNCGADMRGDSDV